MREEEKPSKKEIDIEAQKIWSEVEKYKADKISESVSKLIDAFREYYLKTARITLLAAWIIVGLRAREAIGSARGYVRTLLKTFYEKDMDIERAKELAVYCILQAMKVSRDIGEPIQIGVIRKKGEAEIIDPQEIREIINKINGREQMLHNIWNLLSKDPKFQEDLKNLIERRL
jgi:hypothetical protein